MRSWLVLAAIMIWAANYALAIVAASLPNDRLVHLADDNRPLTWLFLLSTAGFYLGTKPIAAAWHSVKRKLGGG